MEKKAKIITVAGKGGVGKTSICASIVRLLVEKYPDKKILAIDTSVINKKGYSPAVMTDQEKCIACAFCATMCPDCIITVEK